MKKYFYAFLTTDQKKSGYGMVQVNDSTTAQDALNEVSEELIRLHGDVTIISFNNVT